MGSHIFHVGASAMCPHGAPISVASSNARVRVGGQPVALASDTCSIAGCPFQVPLPPGGTKPQPCVSVNWLVPSSRVRVGGQAVVLKVSTGICQSAEQIPQGSPNVVATQFRVSGL